MTEQDFLRQVWRAQDKVVLTNGDTKRILDISFRTKSVQVAVEKGVREWFRCDLIEEHLSYTREPDDIAIIAELHQKLMDANSQNDEYRKIITEQRLKIGNLSNGELKKCVNTLINDLVQKKKILERIENCCVRISSLCDKEEQKAEDITVCDLDDTENVKDKEREMMVRALCQFQNEEYAANSMCMSIDRFRHRILKYGIKKTEWKND